LCPSSHHLRQSSCGQPGYARECNRGLISKLLELLVADRSAEVAADRIAGSIDRGREERHGGATLRRRRGFARCRLRCAGAVARLALELAGAEERSKLPRMSSPARSRERRHRGRRRQSGATSQPRATREPSLDRARGARVAGYVGPAGWKASRSWQGGQRTDDSTPRARHSGTATLSVGVSIVTFVSRRARADRSVGGGGARSAREVGRAAREVGRAARVEHPHKLTAAGRAARLGDRRGDRSARPRRTRSRHRAESTGSEAATRVIIPRVPPAQKSTDLQALFMPEEGLEPPTRGL
jgi:hypothetical protein